jgi:hypothetical protein
MKYIFILLTCLALENAACTKNSNDCTAVIVTQSGTPCGAWGIKVNGTTYPSNNIPDEFKQEGKNVCANYELYEDMRACACCGGTWATINSMNYPTR